MKSIFLFCCFLSLALSGWSQALSGHSYKIPADQLKPEAIVLHINSTFFLTGELLLFKVYCFDKESGKPSDLSSIAYIELIGEDQRPLTQIKVKLEDGVGSGDFFFAGNTPSGNYTLIAYTKWMRNFNYSDFFRTNVTLINPQIKPAISDTFPKSTGTLKVNPQQYPNTGLSVRMDKDEYGRRENITITLAANASASMTLSANVRPVENEIDSPDPWGGSKASSSLLKEISFLPDLRGELLTGTVKHKTNRKPVNKNLISLSSPSTDFEFIMSTTDSTGRYYFNADRIKSEYLLLKIHNLETYDLAIDHENSFLEVHNEFAPAKLKLDTSLRQLMERRQISLQVENAFYSAKKDSVLNGDGNARFIISPDKIYKLDAFTRFPTMDDIFREIIPEVVVKIREGSSSLTMTNAVTGFRFQNQPLILIDGIPVDANVVMKYDPLLIKTISLVKRHYFYGGLETDGIISIETFTGEAKNLNVTDMVRVNYVTPQPPKIYYSPDYSADKDLKRIPDFRTQLYWDPSININRDSTKTLSFYTNDISGKYVVEIIGVTSEGQRVYWRKEFEIR